MRAAVTGTILLCQEPIRTEHQGPLLIEYELTICHNPQGSYSHTSSLTALIYVPMWPTEDLILSP